MSSQINPENLHTISLRSWSEDDIAERNYGPEGERFSSAIVLSEYPYKNNQIQIGTRELKTVTCDFGQLKRDEISRMLAQPGARQVDPLFLIPAFSPNDLRVITNIFKESLTCFNTTLGQIFGYHLLKKLDQLSEKIKHLNQKNKLQTTVEIASANIKSSFYQHLLFRDQLPYILAKYPRAYVGVIDASLESDEKLKNEFESLNEKFNPNNLTETERQTAPELIQEIKDVIQVWGRYLDMPHYQNYWVERRIESVPLVNRLVDPIRNLTEASTYLLFPYKLASAQVNKECLPECMQKIPECAQALKGGNFPYAFAISRRAGMTFGKTSFKNYLAFQRHIGTIVKDMFTEYEKIPLKKSLTSADALSFLEVQSRIRNTSVQNLIATQSRGEDFASSQSIDNMTFRVYEALKTIRHFYNTKNTDLALYWTKNNLMKRTR